MNWDFNFVEISLGPVIVALILMVLDIVTGICKAVKEGNVSSTKLKKGLWNKAGFVGAILLSIICEEIVANFDIDLDIPLCGAVCIYICITEIISIVENLCEISPQLEKLFKNILAKKDEADIEVEIVDDNEALPEDTDTDNGEEKGDDDGDRTAE